MCRKASSIGVEKGFTLVELAIVLVIIGLIVSSVIVGQELIRAAQLRTVIRQQTEYQLAVNTFIGKYNGIPGDLINAASYGLGTNGDGNKTITDTGLGMSGIDGEMGSFWVHLATASFISGSYSGGVGGGPFVVGTDIPSMKFGAAGWEVYGLNTVNYFITGVDFSGIAGDQPVPQAIFTPQEAFNIDSKVDDGLPMSGNVQGGVGGLQANFNALPLNGQGAPCNSAAATPAYNVAVSVPACTLIFTMQTF